MTYVQAGKGTAKPSPDGSLTGKVAIITGASRGIGRATAHLFAERGATVVLAARGDEAVARLADEIGAGGGQALAIKADVSDAVAVEHLVKRIVETYGRLDVAVNNAGISGGRTPLVQVTDAVFDEVVAVNLKGVFLCMKHEISAMQASGGGAIVNVTSTVGLVGYGEPESGLAPYIASKHGVVGLTKAAALEYAAQGIRVNAVAFGTILTEMNQRWYADEHTRQRMISPIPMRRVGDSREAAEAIFWLCSNASTYVTGVTLPVDGGYVIP
jgi:NAD(P)-dependent dehydrogenase (short-subunit alcohol dehydrogenase family)